MQEKVASVRDAGDLAWALARAEGLTMSQRRGWRTRRFLSAPSPQKLGRWKCRPLCSNHVWVAMEPGISAYCVLCVRLRLAHFIFASDSLIFKLLLFNKRLEQRQCMCSTHKHTQTLRHPYHSASLWFHLKVFFTIVKKSRKNISFKKLFWKKQNSGKNMGERTILQT